MKKLYILIILIISSIILYYAFFFDRITKPVKIGFVGALNDKYYVLGNAMMNGIILAFEEEDYKINDKKIELI